MLGDSYGQYTFEVGGYNCSQCGWWVPWNEGHACPTIPSWVPSLHIAGDWPTVDITLHEKLDEILRLLKKLTGE